MLCPTCQQEARRFGRNRNGSQRFVCNQCHKTFTDPDSEAPDRRCVDPAQVTMALRMLLEGTSIRSAERLTGISRQTIIEAMLEAAHLCQRLMDKVLESVPVLDVEADEIWGFVGCKERSKERNGRGHEDGDTWCYVAIERNTKIILTWHVGKRTPYDTGVFARKLYTATHGGRFQLTTDGYGPYRLAIRSAFGSSIDYAQLVKVYATVRNEGEARYSPPEVVDAYPVHQTGNPDEERICTSHAERGNRSIRMAMRRMTRLTDAHSKKLANHKAAFALWFAYYNFCRVHMTLKTTPAVAAGLAADTWSLERLLAEARRVG
jgi:transposase-like protein/IS1 family transposase